MASMQLIFEGLDLKPINVSVYLIEEELQKLTALTRSKNIKMDVTRKVELYLGTEEDPLRMWVIMYQEEYQKMLTLMEEKKISKEEAYEQLSDSGELRRDA